MRDDIRILTKSAEGTGSEQLHEVINRKDEEINQNKASVHQLQNANQILMTSESNLIEKLKVEMDAKDETIKLNVQLETQVQDLAGQLNEMEKLFNEWKRYAESKEKEPYEWKQDAASKEDQRIAAHMNHETSKAELA